MFKVGDTVKIVRKVGVPGAMWVSSMDKTIGKVGKITFIKDNRRYYRVESEDFSWAYVENSIELVSSLKFKFIYE